MLVPALCRYYHEWKLGDVMPRRHWFTAAFCVALLASAAHAATSAPPPTLARLTDAAEDIVLLTPAPAGGWTVDKVLAGTTYHAGDAFDLQIPSYPLEDSEFQN